MTTTTNKYDDFRDLVTTLTALEHNPMPDGLDHLNSYDLVNGERRINAHGSESRGRAMVYASMLELDAEALGRYIGALGWRLPSKDPNRWAHQEDLEQAILLALYVRRGHVRGNWEKAKLVASDTYKTWYKRYVNERQLGVEAAQRAINLENTHAKARQEASKNQRGEAPVVYSSDRQDGMGYNLPDPRWVGWEEAIAGNLDGYRAAASLPADIRDVAERKANGVPISRLERNRLSKWLGGGPTTKSPNTPTNKEVLAAVMAGSHRGEIVWSKPKR
jgi:hypothetical protein